MSKQYVTAVIELPDSEADRKAVIAALSLHGNFHGGKVTAFSIGDLITEHERLVELVSPMDAKRISDSVSKPY